jgi:hypothetical protein
LVCTSLLSFYLLRGRIGLRVRGFLGRGPTPLLPGDFRLSVVARTAPGSPIGRGDMRYHVLVCSGHAETGEVIAARQTFEKLLLLLLTEGFWPHASDTGSSSDLQPGDRVLFCLATKSAPAVVGDALVADPSTPLTAQQLAEIRIYLGPAMPLEAGILTHAVGLDHLAIWDEPWRPPGDDDPVAFDLAKALAGVYRTGSVRPIARETCEQILAQRRLEVPLQAAPATPDALARGSGPGGEPVMLRELLRSSWDMLDFGEPLHVLNGSSVSQAANPADPLDLVCEGGSSGDLVAVACVGRQDPARLIPAFRRRLTWLRENAARLGQRVRGLLLVLDPHAGLDVRAEPDIEIWHLNLSITPVDRQSPQPVLREETPNIRDEAVVPPPTPAQPATPEAVSDQAGATPAPVAEAAPAVPALTADAAQSPADFAQRCMSVPLSRREAGSSS